MPQYHQLLAYAMACLASGDEAEAFKQIDLALQEAERIDPKGPRVAEVYGAMAQMHSQAGQTEKAAGALEQQIAITSKIEGAEGVLPDLYLMLASLLQALGRQPESDQALEAARQAREGREAKPWR